MPNTGEDREIKRRVNANEAEVIRESKKLVQKVKADLIWISSEMSSSTSGEATRAREQLSTQENK